ncbi:hydrolase [Corynebacterium heidelbergense]|uniref:Hydrolase n=1 Tax=Corynebacterium heidelbergense TaxID=2055947 RepID=A0A364V7W9_9CORY|nr:hydrolase [Corynebacterium heidelbergense]
MQSAFLRHTVRQTISRAAVFATIGGLSAGAITTTAADPAPQNQAPQNQAQDQAQNQAPQGQGQAGQSAAAPAPGEGPAAKPADAEAAEVQRLLEQPVPTDFDGLLNRAETISRAAAATSDNVEKTRAGIAENQARIDQIKADTQRSEEQLAQAQQRLDGSQTSVSQISSAKYRGATVDAVSSVVGASGPQAAIDRTAYMNALADRTDRAVSALEADLQSAHEANSAAKRAKAQAEFQANNLAQRQRELDERNHTLTDLKAQVTKIVDGFTPEQKRQWVDRKGPIDVDVATFLGKLPAAGPASANVGGAVAAAMSKLGSPYAWGAAGPSAFDCSGLMMWAYQQVGKTIPRTSQAQLSGGKQVSVQDLQPGDIVAYYPGATHVGMYIGDGKLVHASDYGIPVQVVPVNSMPIVGAVRY